MELQLAAEQVLRSAANITKGSPGGPTQLVATAALERLRAAMEPPAPICEERLDRLRSNVLKCGRAAGHRGMHRSTHRYDTGERIRRTTWLWWRRSGPAYRAEERR